jgi:hypothetical protein
MLALWLMTALGQSRHFDRAPLTSGLPPTPEILSARRHVSNVPKAEVAQPSGQNKGRPKAALNSNLMIEDHAAINAGFDLRR